VTIHGVKEWGKRSRKRISRIEEQLKGLGWRFEMTMSQNGHIHLNVHPGRRDIVDISNVRVFPPSGQSSGGGSDRTGDRRHRARVRNEDTIEVSRRTRRSSARRPMRRLRLRAPRILRPRTPLYRQLLGTGQLRLPNFTKPIRIQMPRTPAGR